MSQTIHETEPTTADQLVASSDRFLVRFVDLWLLISLAVVAFYSFRFQEIPRPYALSGMLVCGIAARAAIWVGRLRVARWLMVGGLALLSLALPFLINGVRSPAIAVWLLLIPMAGWLMNRRAAVLLCLLAAVGVGLAYWLEAVGLFVLSIPLRQPLAWMQTWVALLLLCGLTVWHLIGAYESVQERERELRRRLDLANASLAAQLTQRTDQLEEADQSLAQVRSEYEKAYPLAMLAAMVPAVTHDLYTPLSNIGLAGSGLRAHLDELRERIASGKLRRSDLEGFVGTVDESLQIIEHANARASELVGSLKQISIHQVAQRRSSFLLDQLVNEVVTTLTPMLRKQPVKLLKELAPDLRMDSYPGPLEQVLVNLVQNALVHAFEGRSSGTITLRARALDADHVQVVVEDDGLGMVPAVLARLFEPFFTTKAGQGGSGIGLAFSRKLVEQTLGGHILVESRPGEGSRFIIELPRQAPEQPAPH